MHNVIQHMHTTEHYNVCNNVFNTVSRINNYNHQKEGAVFIILYMLSSVHHMIVVAIYIVVMINEYLIWHMDWHVHNACLHLIIA